MKTKALRELNDLSYRATLRIGQKIKLPFPQKWVDAIATASYKVEKGDTLTSIARKFKLTVSELREWNKLKRRSTLRIGKELILPLPHKLKELGKSFGTRKLRVTATAYSSHRAQTDSTPFLAAWNNRLRPGMKAIAVSRDLLSRYGIRNGTKVKIAGLPGIYRVKDKMNKRYRKRIDIYMGVDRRRALRWGKRSVVIYW
jgi:LysM repeat protein